MSPPLAPLAETGLLVPGVACHSLPWISIVGGRRARCGVRVGRVVHSRCMGNRGDHVNGTGALGRRLGGGESSEENLCGGCVTVEHGKHGWNLIEVG